MSLTNPRRPSRGSILFLGTDEALGTAIDPHLAGFGLALETFQVPAELDRRLVTPENPPPLLVLVDLRAFANFVPAADPGPGPSLPLVGLGDPGDLQQRLAALHAGAAACLSPDLPAADLAARLAALVGPADGPAARILVVDDQPVAALFAERVLQQAGMVTQRVSDPLEVLAALDRFMPDLVLMDLHMPGVSGIELTGVIRAQERYADLLIVFLSAELDPARQLEALRIGGDDFLAKPVPPAQLVACVRRRLLQVRQRDAARRAAAVPDAPPGLAGRERLLARLDRLIRSTSGEDWALAYLEQEGDEAALTRLAAAVTARAGAEALAARVGEQGIGVLLRSGAGRPFSAAAQALGQCVRADLAAAAGAAPVPPFGVGWCAVAESGGESVTLVSRARKAARISLQATQGRAQGYVRASSRDAAAARDPLLAAIAAGQFQILFQPIVPLHAAAAERYEATLRLTGPQGELLAPGVFVPVALRAGQTARIDRWLLTAGLDALRERRAAGRPVELFLHQSIAAAADDAWVEWVRDEIAARDLIQCRPIIQLQLADADRHLDLAARRAEQLHRLRIRLCLNGFMVGERGERVLARLPVAYVRLAREAAQGLSDGRLLSLFGDPRGRKTLVIATGVEGPEAITPLYCAGVDLVQGSYVQPPTEAMDFDFADAGA
ncbi:EAL domain-containing protein [Candidatus Thiodictyon syntrophicum]|jgi:EAL domain-containing protein (putative c-di-GMP-specific phosphodiesterase class I)/DNA-binding response OmpR family regulator|uniref:Response regulator receiver protein n=1 Tax=Candidatus Thiodictyon syntrophicum TaxID=1166950 RepID=A0A2K8U6H1_9GAMM|nr:EAL domain-containing protein [Candidatus Thiodictyon syntrophicum]AUB81009.1 hypothetical protein THSYN_08630 [Candidatus Thiodictyon syntrophicum]